MKLQTNDTHIFGLDDLAAAVPCCKTYFRNVHLERALRNGVVMKKPLARGAFIYYSIRHVFERYLVQHQRDHGYV